MPLGRASRSRGSAGPAFFHRAAKIGENFFAHARDARGVPLLHLDAEFFQRRLGGPEEHGTAAGGVTRPRASASVSEMENVPAP